MKKCFLFFCLLLLLTSIGMAAFAAPPDANYQLLFADEFDNGMDLDKWYYRTGSRLGGYNYPENVEFKDGKMYHIIRYDKKNGEEQLTGGGIISNELFGYGYYETKCQLFGATGGMHSSFWSMGLNGDGEKSPKYNTVYEFDGYEIDSDDKNTIHCNINLKINAMAGIPGAHVNKFPTDTEFTFGYEWLPNELNWYLNGEKIQSWKGDEIPIHYAQQNLWITGLANTGLSGSIDKSKLPGNSNWDYVRYYAMPMKDINLLGASEFEYNKNPDFATERDLQYPVAWMESGDIEASFVEQSDFAVGGNHVLTHKSDKNYKVTTSQKLYYIPNGNYSFEAYVMSSGGQKTAKVRISGFDGETVKEIDIPKSDKMTLIEIADIEVKDNGAYFEIISDAKAEQWIHMDNPSFYATSGKEVEKAIPYATKLSELRPGETVVTLKDSGFSKSEGWQSSSLAGYKNEKSIFVYGTETEAWAEFKLIAPENGIYDINFYKVAHTNSGKGCHVSYIVNGKEKAKGVDLTTNAGWEKLGGEELKKGDEVIVRIDAKNGGTLRASAASIALSGSESLSEMLILELDRSQVWAKGIKTPLDENPDIKAKTVQGRTMVPVRFIAENLGATVNYIDETEEIVITQGQNTVILKVNSPVMKVNGKEIMLDASAFVENGRTLVPVRAISEGLNKIVTWVPDKFVVIADSAVPTTKEYAGLLENIGK